MLIQAHLLSLSLLVSVQVNAASGRRKGELRQPPEFENWEGKWFPFDPKMPVPTKTTTTTSTTTTTKPITTTKPHRTTTGIPNVVVVDDWPGKYFPFKPSYVIPAKPKPICDDGQHSIELDFDPKKKRHSFNYLCLDTNRTHYTPNLNVEAIQIEHAIPPAFVMPAKCLNESITYDVPLPTFGAFRPLASKYGTYRYLPPQRWLRSAAEGAIVMLYHPCANPRQVKSLQNTLKSCLYRHIITPSQGLNAERPLALMAWGKCLQMSVVDEKVVIDFIKKNAKLGPIPSGTTLVDGELYEAGLLEEAKLITDTEDIEICGYKEM